MSNVIWKICKLGMWAVKIPSKGTLSLPKPYHIKSISFPSSTSLPEYVVLSMQCYVRLAIKCIKPMQLMMAYSYNKSHCLWAAVSSAFCLCLLFAVVGDGAEKLRGALPSKHSDEEADVGRQYSETTSVSA